MASENRTEADSLTFLKQVAAHPYRFGFRNLLRRIECLYSDKPRLGESRRPVDDPIRLTQSPSMAFAPSELAAIDFGEDDAPPWVEGYFFGLFGPNGPLPLHMTEYARDRLRNSNDPTLVRFTGIFHHRMLALFYRAWANAQPTVNFDRPQTDQFALYVGALMGLGSPALRNRDALPDLAKFSRVGQLSCQRRPADALRDLVRDFFGVQVEVEEFVGEWLVLPEESRLQLGTSLQTGSLGMTAAIGARCWQSQQKFRLVFGPLAYSQFAHFLPGNKSLEKLIALVRNFVGDELSWDVNLILNESEIPALKLGETGRLGWTTWLSGASGDANDATFDPVQAVTYA